METVFNFIYKTPAGTLVGVAIVENGHEYYKIDQKAKFSEGFFDNSADHNGVAVDNKYISSFDPEDEWQMVAHPWYDYSNGEGGVSAKEESEKEGEKSMVEEKRFSVTNGNCDQNCEDYNLEDVEENVVNYGGLDIEADGWEEEGKKACAELESWAENAQVGDEFNWLGVTVECTDAPFWSVRSESNSYADDEYNGTFDECVEYAKENKLNPIKFNLVKRMNGDDYAIDAVNGTEVLATIFEQSDFDGLNYEEGVKLLEDSGYKNTNTEEDKNIIDGSIIVDEYWKPEETPDDIDSNDLWVSWVSYWKKNNDDEEEEVNPDKAHWEVNECL